MALKILINAAEIARQFQEFAAEAKADIEAGVATLARATHAKVKDLAAEDKLASTADILDENMRYEEVAPGIHVISILEKAMFIEEGLPANFDMKPGLLNSKSVKTKNGHRYLNVPFDHTKAPSRSTPQAKELIGRIRENLKKEGISTHRIERNGDGSPRVGKLHEFSWGGNIPGKGNTGDMQRVSIYQTPDKSRKSGVRRDIFTFRTVTDTPASRDKWMHPGMEGKKFLDKAAEWAMNEWETDILPQIIKKWDTK